MPTKSPAATLDYKFAWVKWLQAGEQITAATVTATGVTVGTVSHTANSVTVWLSGGTDRTIAEVVCTITTDGGRTDERTETIPIRTR